MSVLNIVLFCAAGFLLGVVISWLVSNIASRLRNRTARRRVEPQMNVKLQGLDAGKTYTVKETNLMPGKQSELECDGKQYSGDYLMKVGLNVFTAQDGTSHVLTLE